MPDVITIGETLAAFAPVESVRLRYASGFRMRIAGAESNTAIGLQKLGCSTGWISRLGDDEFGAFVLNSIRSEGVDTTGVHIDPSRRTGVMFKQPLANNETEVSYYRDGSAASALSPDDIDAASIANAKLLHVTGITPALSKSCHRTIVHAMDIAAKNRTPVSFDPNIRLKLWKETEFHPILTELIARSNILMLGMEEAEILFSTKSVEQIFQAVFKFGSITHLALKDGANGSYAGTSTDYLHIPPHPCKCIDPVGAGDGYNAGFLFGLLEGMDIEQCGKIGNIVGALATETKGDIEGYPSRKYLEQLLQKKQNIFR